MAYITAEEVAVIRTDLKKAFPYVKFAVRREHSSSVNVVILKAPFNFDFSSPRRSYQGKQYFDVNHHWIDRSDEDRQRTATDDDGNSNRLGDHEAYVFLRAVKEIVTKKWWDKSDVQSDYFHTAFYYDIKVGSWEKPFEQTVRPEGLDVLTEKEDNIEVLRDLDLATVALAKTQSIVANALLNADLVGSAEVENIKSLNELIETLDTKILMIYKRLSLPGVQMVPISEFKVLA